MKTTQFAYPFIIIIVGIGAWISYNKPTQLTEFGIIGAVILLLFYRLSIEVKGDIIKMVLGLGLFRKSFRKSEIASIKSVTYLSYGWGIRFQRDRTIYSVTGNKGVELTFKDGRTTIVLGCNNPDQLVEFLQKE